MPTRQEDLCTPSVWDGSLQAYESQGSYGRYGEFADRMMPMDREAVKPGVNGRIAARYFVTVIWYSNAYSPAA
jgi:hypothetical protein